MPLELPGINVRAFKPRGTEDVLPLQGRGIHLQRAHALRFCRVPLRKTWIHRAQTRVVTLEASVTGELLGSTFG